MEKERLADVDVDFKNVPVKSEELSNIKSDIDQLTSQFARWELHYGERRQPFKSVNPYPRINNNYNNADGCRKCKKPGHFVKFCPELQCFKCQQYGHIASVCNNSVPRSTTFPNNIPIVNRPRDPTNEVVKPNQNIERQQESGND